MRKTIAVFMVAAVAFTLSASTVLANNGNGNKDKDDNNRGLQQRILGQFKDFDRIRPTLSTLQFALVGSVNSVSTNTIVVNVNGAWHVPTLTNGTATVTVDANTKYSANKNKTIALADVKVGQQVLVMGNVNVGSLTATIVRVNENINNQFSLSGTVGSTTSGSIVVNVTNSKNLPTLTNNLATVNVDANTKYKADKNATVTLADVKAGQKIDVSGTVSGTTLLAQTVKIKLPSGKAYGEVTAKTATSVTVKNTVTGVIQTINTDADTQVKINGETKTVADVQVGDKGFVKFKTRLTGMFAKVINLFR